MSVLISILYDLLGEQGSISTVRVMSLASLAAGIGLAIYGITNNKDLGSLAQLCAVFVGAGFMGKTVQKMVEK